MKKRCQYQKCIRKPIAACKKCRRDICEKHSKNDLCLDCANHKSFF